MSSRISGMSSNNQSTITMNTLYLKGQTDPKAAGLFSDFILRYLDDFVEIERRIFLRKIAIDDTSKLLQENRTEQQQLDDFLEEKRVFEDSTEEQKEEIREENEIFADDEKIAKEEKKLRGKVRVKQTEIKEKKEEREEEL